MAAEVTFEEARAAFPVLERVAYLNAGSMGPLMRSTTDAVIRAATSDLERGRAGKRYFEEMLALREGVRERIAALLSVDAENVALTSSTTDGCNIVLAGLDLGPGDEVLTSDAEHPGLLAPLHATGARVVVAPTSEHRADEALDLFLERITPRTKVLALSHVCWTTGQLFPVHELKARTGLPILVDGAQSVGAIEVKAGDADFYTVSCQKWLCGPDPLGALYVREPERLSIARPTYFSQLSIAKDGSFDPKPGALRFDSGWLAPPSLAGLLAALEGAPPWRYGRAAEAASRCGAILADVGLEVVTEPRQSTLVTFVPRGDPAETSAAAFEQGVVIRDLPGTAWCRVSCGYWTSDGDLERLVAAVA